MKYPAAFKNPVVAVGLAYLWRGGLLQTEHSSIIAQKPPVIGLQKVMISFLSVSPNTWQTVTG